MNPSGTCASNRHVSTLLAYQMVLADSFSGVSASSSFHEEAARVVRETRTEKRWRSGGRTERAEPEDNEVGENCEPRQEQKFLPVEARRAVGEREQRKWDKFAEAESNRAES